MAFLLEHLPPQVHLVIASRADPPLPLAGLRARGELLEVRAADLRFTTDEAAAYLNDAMGLTLDAGDVDALEARTEGWIAALQLAALSMQGRDDIAGVHRRVRRRRPLRRRLPRRGGARAPDRRRSGSFLLETSILDRLTGPLCDAVTGRTGGRAMLEQLDRANLFLVPLDDRRTWYRYHHLFADVLRARLLDEHPDTASPSSTGGRATGTRRTATAPRRSRHAMAGEHVERAARAHRAGRAADAPDPPGGDAAPLARGAARRALRRPAGAHHRRWSGARMATGDPTGVEPLLELRRSPALDAPAPPPIVFDHDEFARLPAQVAVYRAALALLAGDIDGTIAHATRALDARRADRPPPPRQRATALLGLAHWTTGDLERGASAATPTPCTSLIAAGHLADVLGCSLALADIQIAQGRLGDATRTFEAGLELDGGAPRAARHGRHARRAERGAHRTQRPRRRGPPPAGEHRARRARRAPAARLPLARRDGPPPPGARATSTARSTCSTRPSRSTTPTSPRRSGRSPP